MHFLESQDLESIAAEPILVSTGLQALSDILDKQASLNTSVADYLQQALLSMMISAVSRIDVSIAVYSIASSISEIRSVIGCCWYGQRGYWRRGYSEDDQR